MSNNVFIPDNDGFLTLSGIKKGAIHYNFKEPVYQGVTRISMEKDYKLMIEYGEKLSPFFNTASDKNNFYNKLFYLNNNFILPRIIIVGNYELKETEYRFILNNQIISRYNIRKNYII